ncbi:hypothetical protein V6N13_118756 [Hibiscus sabdariffa]
MPCENSFHCGFRLPVKLGAVLVPTVADAKAFFPFVFMGECPSTYIEMINIEFGFFNDLSCFKLKITFFVKNDRKQQDDWSPWIAWDIVLTDM